MNLRLQAIYDHIPEVECKCKCQQACGMVPAHPLEIEEIRAYTGHRVRVRKQNWGLKYQNYLVLEPKNGSLECRYLRRGKCRIHPVRPLVCRLYGVASGLECQHGCLPKQRLSRDEAHRLIAEMNELEVPDGTKNRKRTAG